ncbi:hypothetical protein Tco_0337579 [Tanacetum coccineum]
MAVLESCPKHNMVAYLEKTEGNAKFHEMSAKSKIINNVRYKTAKVAGKPVSISEAPIRSDLLFDDADGIVNVPVPLDHFPVNALTSKVFSFMVKKGKHFSGKVTPLFASMLVQSTEDEGATLERPSEPQPTPSPPHPSKANVEPQSDQSHRPSPTPHIPDSIPEVSGGNHGDLSLEKLIYHALTVSPVVSTTFVEQFWTSAKSKTINNVRHITAKIAGKSVSISEASIRTDLILMMLMDKTSLPIKLSLMLFILWDMKGFNCVPFEQQPDPSPSPSPKPSPRPSPTPIIPDSIPEPTGENLGDHSSNDTSHLGNEDDMTL